MILNRIKQVELSDRSEHSKSQQEIQLYCENQDSQRNLRSPNTGRSEGRSMQLHENSMKLDIIEKDLYEKVEQIQILNNLITRLK